MKKLQVKETAPDNPVYNYYPGGDLLRGDNLPWTIFRSPEVDAFAAVKHKMMLSWPYTLTTKRLKCD